MLRKVLQILSGSWPQSTSRRVLLGTCAALVLPGSPSVQAAITVVSVTVRNDSNYTVRVTVSGFRGTSRSAILGPRSKPWATSVTTQDKQCLITASANNTITTRVGSGASRAITNDRRVGYIIWAR